MQLPQEVSQITITYRTSPEAGALQWLQPSQTAGGKRPYLYSQGEAIFTRTWIPTQDTPGVRQTYSARITVPRDLRAVMSAEQLTPDGVETAGGRTFEFRLTHPVPPYLIAIGVGDLAYRQVGPRTGVYTEPAMLDAAANELVDLEKMVAAAESLLGPYRWGRFDVLVLPPSFPLGGMENPRLTFATPTIIAGDRSLVSLIAHELAHSWSGNLVTNAHVERLLAQRRLHDLRREPADGSALRRRPRPDAPGPRPPVARHRDRPSRRQRSKDTILHWT